MWLEENKWLTWSVEGKTWRNLPLRTFAGYLDLKLGRKKEISIAIVIQLARSRSRNGLLVFLCQITLNPNTSGLLETNATL